MTEQPPSAEALEIADGQPLAEVLRLSLARDIDALIAQRVSAAVNEFLECAKYDALMEGPQFRTWDRSALDRLRKKHEAIRAQGKQP